MIGDIKCSDTYKLCIVIECIDGANAGEVYSVSYIVH